MRVVSGSAKGIILKTPKGKKIRPTSDKVKSAFFNIIFDYIIGANYLDLFAGTGSMGIEALSRGAKRCTFIDKSSYSISLLKKNLFITGFDDRAYILKCDAYRAIDILSKKKELYNVIYIDPPYNIEEENVRKLLWAFYYCNIVDSEGIIGLEQSVKSAGFLLKDSPYTLLDRKTYGDTALAILEPH